MTVRRVWRIGFVALCAAWWLRKLGWLHPVGQWDFRVYYFASQAWRAGLDPYDPRVLPLDLSKDGLKFSYPPYALALFAPFTTLPVTAATELFLALKTIALGFLLTIWSRLLQTTVTDPVWVLFLMFAYSSAIFVDFISGSITTFEQLLIWIGVGALIGRRYWPFVGAVVAASLFRMTPIALLGVCLFAPDRRGVRYVAAGLGAFAAILLATWGIAPRLTAGFIGSLVANVGERGWLNPAALPLAIDISGLMGRAVAPAVSPSARLAIYVAIVAAVLIPAIITLRRLSRDPGAPRMDLIVYVAFLAIGLVLPRFKNYSYMLLIVPTYYIATRSTRLRAAVPLLLLVCLPVYSWITTPGNLALLADYSKWLTALGALALYVYETHAGAPLTASAEVT